MKKERTRSVVERIWYTTVVSHCVTAPVHYTPAVTVAMLMHHKLSPLTSHGECCSAFPHPTDNAGVSPSICSLGCQNPCLSILLSNYELGLNCRGDQPGYVSLCRERAVRREALVQCD